jgi:hypothetical protein
VFRLKRPDSKVGLSISSGNEGDDFRLEEKSGVLYTGSGTHFTALFPSFFGLRSAVFFTHLSSRSLSKCTYTSRDLMCSSFFVTNHIH